jgi:hypothetical protein
VNTDQVTGIIKRRVPNVEVAIIDPDSGEKRLVIRDANGDHCEMKVGEHAVVFMGRIQIVDDAGLAEMIA